MTPYLPIPCTAIGKAGFWLCLLILFPGLLPTLRAQSLLVPALQFDFIQHLIDNKSFDEAKWSLRQMAARPYQTAAEKDSLQYYLGQTYYLNAQVDSSILAHEKIGKSSTFYAEASFFQAFGLLYTRRYTDAQALLHRLDPTDSCQKDFRQFIMASHAILNRDWLQFDQNWKNLSHPVCTPFEAEKQKLPDYARKFKSNKRKSAWKAGLFSALIPGSGKYYAGYRGQALASLFPCLVFGATTAESYFRAGPKSAAFIISASMFSLFYIGNIWGSTLSVKTIYEQRNEEYRHRLLLDVQVPLHRIFGR